MKDCKFVIEVNFIENLEEMFIIGIIEDYDIFS